MNLPYWITDFYPLWAVGVVVVIVSLWKRIKKRKTAKEKKEEDNVALAQNFHDTLFIEQGFNILNSLYDQKKAIETELRNITNESKLLTKRNTDLERYYKQQKDIIRYNQNQLALRYNTNANQLIMTNKSIDSRERMEGRKKNE